MKIMITTPPKTGEFYRDVLTILLESKIPFMVSGTYAVSVYTGIDRETKDLDIFCRAGDYAKILELFAARGFKTSVPDERWLAKIHKGQFFCDIIFSLAAAMTPITDAWFKEKKTAELFGIKVPVVPPTELIWAKVIVQSRVKNDMADIMHLILRTHKQIDWRRLMAHMDQYWEILLITILYFRFVYPSEREIIPRWLIDELLTRLGHQMQLPTLEKKVCRGRLLSKDDYEIDLKEWGFLDLTA